MWVQSLGWEDPLEQEIAAHYSILAWRILWTIAHQALLSRDSCPWHESWNGLPFSPPGDLPDPGIEPTSLMSLAMTGRFFTTGPPVESVRNRLGQG